MNALKNKLMPIVFTAFAIIFCNLFANGASCVIVSEKDKVILQEKLDRFSPLRNLPMGQLILKIGMNFRGTPYVAKTLDKDIAENLIVNLREFDCTTFVENCLAIARTIKSGHPSFESFIAELERIRYRKGQLNGYASRLHYFSEWITDNSSKGIVTDVTAHLGGIKHPVFLNFMSTHANLYPQLKENPSLINKIKLIETRVSARSFSFIPKEKIVDLENGIHDGDIIALTTRIAGMDVSHVGMIFQKEGRLFLLHASQTAGEVSTTNDPLELYLNGLKNVTGIFVVRAK